MLFAPAERALYESAERQRREERRDEQRCLNKARVEAMSDGFLFTSGTVAYPLSIAVAMVNAYACLAFHAILAVYYATRPARA